MVTPSEYSPSTQEVEWQNLLPKGVAFTEYILGTDEVGNGALAGPIVVVAVAMPPDFVLKGLRDSKDYRGDGAHEQRVEIAALVKDYVVTDGVLPAETIDLLGVEPALLVLHQTVINESLKVFPDSLVIVDGDMVLEHAISLQKADSFVPSVMAASVVAKVQRDTFMIEVVHERYPEYGFDKHKGYGTIRHFAALKKWGPCPYHRHTFLKFMGSNIASPGLNSRLTAKANWTKMRR